MHFPIAFLGLSYALDISYKYFPAIFRRVPIFSQLPVSSVPTTSYFLLSLGLLTALPAVLTGGAELMNMVARQDLGGKLSKSGDKLGVLKNMHPKLKVAFAHAALMDVAILGSAYNWWARGSVTGYTPSETDAMAGAVFLVAVFGSAALGGMLVYEHGVGVVGTKRAGKSE